MTELQSSADRPAQAHGNVWFVLIAVFIDMVGIGIAIPVLPKLIVEFEGGDLRSATAMVGVFGFAWALMQFLFQPVLGALSDRFGRRPVIIVGLVLGWVMLSVLGPIYDVITKLKT